MEKAKLLISPAPMPEDPVDARLTGLLVPAPHVVPEKKAKKVATGTRKSSRNQASDDDEDSSPEDEEEEYSLPEEGEKKRKASPIGGGRRVQEGENYPPGQFRQHHRWRGGVAFKGQASGKIVMQFLSCRVVSF